MLILGLQGEAENQLLAYAATQPAGSIEVCSAKPGIVTGSHLSGMKGLFSGLLVSVGIVSKVGIQELAAAMLQQVQVGFEKEPLENDDLIRIGQKALASIAGGTKADGRD